MTQVTVVLATCYTVLKNAEVVVWPFTTINSYWIAHALVQK